MDFAYADIGVNNLPDGLTAPEFVRRNLDVLWKRAANAATKREALAAALISIYSSLTSKQSV